MKLILLILTATCLAIATIIRPALGEELRLSSDQQNVAGSTNDQQSNEVPPLGGKEVANITVTVTTTTTTTSAAATTTDTDTGTTMSITKSTTITGNSSNGNSLDGPTSQQHINTELQMTTPSPKLTHNLPKEENPVPAGESEVKQLGLDDLSGFTATDSVVLFYVPWCVFCRGIMPEFEKAAYMFKGKNIKFGKIDCNEHRKAVLLEQVIRFPTIKVYSEGQSQYYVGLPNAVSIVNFVNSEFNRDILISDLNVLKVFRNTDNNSIKVVAIIDHEERSGSSSLSPVSPAYARLTHKYHNIFFAHALSNNTQVINFIQNYSSKHKGITSSVAVKANTLAIFTPWDDDDDDDDDGDKSGGSNNTDQHGIVLVDKVDLNNFEGLEKLVLKYQYPLVIEFNPIIAQKMFSSEKTTSFLFINKDVPNFKAILEKYKRIAKDFRGEILFVKSGTLLAHERRIAQALISEDCHLPCISIIKFPAGEEGKLIAPALSPGMPPIKRSQPPLVYRSHISGPQLLKDSNIEHFIQDFVSGRLNPYFKSEEPPSEEDNDGAVRIVVSKTFKKEVIEPNLDVLIVFYAPWCGHCRKLEPDYNALAQRLRGISDKLKIAKIDGSQNEVENIQILGYPSILLFKSGNKTDPILYSGERSVANMIEWISQNASFKFDHLQYLNPELAFEDDDLDMEFSHEL